MDIYFSKPRNEDLTNVVENNDFVPIESSAENVLINHQYNKAVSEFLAKQKKPEKESWGTWVLAKLWNNRLVKNTALKVMDNLVEAYNTVVPRAEDYEALKIEPDFKVTPEDVAGHEWLMPHLCKCTNREQVEWFKGIADWHDKLTQAEIDHGNLLTDFAGAFLNPEGWFAYGVTKTWLGGVAGWAGKFFEGNKILNAYKSFTTLRQSEGFLKTYGRSIAKTIPGNIGFGLAFGATALPANELSEYLINDRHITGDEILGTLTTSMLLGIAFGGTLGAYGDISMQRKAVFAAENFNRYLKNKNYRTVEDVTVVVNPTRLDEPGYVANETNKALEKTFNTKVVSESTFGTPKESFGSVLPLTHGLRLAQSVCPESRIFANTAINNFIKMVDEKGNLLANNANNIENVIGYKTATYIGKHMFILQKHFKEWMQKKYEKDPNWIGEKLSKVRKLITGNSKDWQEFNELLFDAARHKDAHYDPIIERCAKELRPNADAVSQEAMDVDLMGVQKAAVKKSQKEFDKSNEGVEKLENTTRVRINVGTLNGTKVYKNVKISAARNHLERNKQIAEKTQGSINNYKTVLGELEKGEVNSVKIRKLLAENKELESSYNKATKAEEKQTQKEETKDLKELFRLEDAAPKLQRSVKEALDIINTNEKEGITYQELSDIGKLGERISSKNKEIAGYKQEIKQAAKELKDVRSSAVIRKELQFQKILKRQIQFIDADKKSSAGAKSRELEQRGALKRKLTESIKKVKEQEKLEAKVQAKLEKLNSSDKIQNTIDERDLLKLQLDFLKAKKSSNKGPTAIQGKRLGKVEEKYNSTLKRIEEIKQRISKREEAIEKSRTKRDEKFYKESEELLAQIDELSKDPNTKTSPRTLNRLIGNVKNRISVLEKQLKNVNKNTEEVSNNIEKGLSKIKDKLDVAYQKRDAAAKALKESQERKYTVENDLHVLGDESWVFRSFLRDKILNHETDFKSDVIRGYIDASENKDLFIKPKEKLTAEEQQILEQELAKYKKYADNIVEEIRNTSYGRVSAFGMEERGSELQRKLPISTDFILNWVDRNYCNVMIRAFNTLIRDTQVKRVFGTLDSQEILQPVKDGFLRIREQYRDNPKMLKRLDGWEKQDCEDVVNVLHNLRGTHIADSHNFMHSTFIRKAGVKAIQAWNVMRLMGGVPLSALNDYAIAPAVLTFKSVFGEGLRTFMNFVRTKFTKSSMKQCEDLFNASTAFLESRTDTTFAEAVQGEGIYASILNFFKGGANITTRASLMPAIDRTNKLFYGFVGAQKIIKAGEKLSRNVKLTKRESSFLTSTGVTEKQALDIFEQVKKHGVKQGGQYSVNIDKWSDAGLRDLMYGAIYKIQNQVIVTPGAGTTPSWFKDPVWGLLKQFQSFTYAAYEKVVVPFMQTRDMTCFAGFSMMMSIGVLRALYKAKVGGYELDADEVLLRAAQESEVLVHCFDYFGFGNFLWNFNKDQRMSNQDFYRSVGGTVLDFTWEGFQAARGMYGLFFGEGATDSQIHAMRKLCISQNNIALVHFYNMLEDYLKSRYSTTKRKQYY